MAWFQFEAKDRAGTVHRDRLEAPDVRHAHQLLAARNWFIVKVQEEAMGKRAMAAAARRADWLPALQRTPIAEALRASRRRREIPVKTEQMSQLLRAGMRLGEVLSVMSRRSSDPAWKAIFEDLRSGVVGGKSLSESMAAHPAMFDSLFRAMVAAGEVSGHLVEVLERLAQYLQRREMIRQRVKGALIYPSFIVTAGIGTVTFFMIYMLPKLAGMFKELGRALPWSTQMLISISDFLVRFGWTIPLIFLAIWVIVRQWLRDSENRMAFDRSRLGWPVIGALISLGEHSRFTQTLATLLKSGVTLVDALQVAEATLGNSALRHGVRDARIAVREGKSLNEALAGQKLFPDLMLDMLAVGERTGDLGGALHHTANTYERELDRAIQTFTALIEPVLIVLMAFFVGGIVLSVLMAVFDLTSGIGRM